MKVFKALVAQPDMEWVFIDGSYAKAHQHSAGATSGNDETLAACRTFPLAGRIAHRSWNLTV